MTRLGAIGGDREALVTSRHELDRAIEPFRRERDQRRAGGYLASRAEGAADIGTDHAHLVRFYVQRFCHGVLKAVDELAWLIDRELAIGPCTGGGEQLDRLWCCVGVEYSASTTI